MTKNIVSRSQPIIKTFGFDDFGWTPLKKPITIEIYKDWLSKGMHGEMDFLEAHLPYKENPHKLMDKALSALVVTKSYRPHPYPADTPLPVSTLRTALYAQGIDYHFSFKKQIEDLAQQLKTLFPGESFVAMTDSSPVLERDLAYQAGLGWFGKNSCLLNRKKGSLFFIGEIYSTLSPTEIEPRPLATDHCGTCTRCIDICPTGAIVENRKIDANKCISYLTIESKTDPSDELKPLMQDWFFGCDLCQTVCPWNEKVFGKEDMQTLTNNYVTQTSAHLIDEIQWLLNSSNKSIEKQLLGTPMARSRGRRLKRNAIIIAGNLKLTSLREDIEKVSRQSGLLNVCEWALKQLNS